MNMSNVPINSDGFQRGIPAMTPGAWATGGDKPFQTGWESIYGGMPIADSSNKVNQYTNPPFDHAFNARPFTQRYPFAKDWDKQYHKMLLFSIVTKQDKMDRLFKLEMDAAKQNSPLYANEQKDPRDASQAGSPVTLAHLPAVNYLLLEMVQRLGRSVTLAEVMSHINVIGVGNSPQYAVGFYPDGVKMQAVRMGGVIHTKRIWENGFENDQLFLIIKPIAINDGEHKVIDFYFDPKNPDVSSVSIELVGSKDLRYYYEIHPWSSPANVPPPLHLYTLLLPDVASIGVSIEDTEGAYEDEEDYGKDFTNEGADVEPTSTRKRPMGTSDEPPPIPKRPTNLGVPKAHPAEMEMYTQVMKSLQLFPVDNFVRSMALVNDLREEYLNMRNDSSILPNPKVKESIFLEYLLSILEPGVALSYIYLFLYNPELFYNDVDAEDLPGLMLFFARFDMSVDAFNGRITNIGEKKEEQIQNVAFYILLKLSFGQGRGKLEEYADFFLTNLEFMKLLNVGISSEEVARISKGIVNYCISRTNLDKDELEAYNKTMTAMASKKFADLFISFFQLSREENRVLIFDLIKNDVKDFWPPPPRANPDLLGFIEMTMIVCAMVAIITEKRINKPGGNSTVRVKTGGPDEPYQKVLFTTTSPTRLIFGSWLRVGKGREVKPPGPGPEKILFPKAKHDFVHSYPDILDCQDFEIFIDSLSASKLPLSFQFGY